jgi:transposase
MSVNGTILQCDGYAAYKQLVGSTPASAVTLAFCWSHVRRGFYGLARAKAPIATEALSRIAALYRIEGEIRGRSAAQRYDVRQVESKRCFVAVDPAACGSVSLRGRPAPGHEFVDP